MITQCKNCAGQLVFDPKEQKLVCGHCGSTFAPEEFNVADKEELFDQQATSMNSVYGTKSEDLMDCYVYTCATCGGEVMINGTEASTKCIYCGSSTVVFNRIAKQKRPQFIIPFKITKEEAETIVRSRFKKGIFIPKEIKHFEADNIRGIYIPYWLVDCEHKGAVVIQGTVKSGKSSRTVYYGRSGRLSLKNLPIDASKMLSDESSSRLEPFNINGMKPFDEDYLLGFYSNVSDVDYGDLRQAARTRAEFYFNTAALADVSGCSNKAIISSNQNTIVNYNDLKYAMFPAWFVTYFYKGQHNTILVNGQNGKIVCGVPWNKGLFYSLLVLSGAVLTAASYLISKPIFAALFNSSDDSDSGGKTIMFIILSAIGLFTLGIRRIVKVIKSINLTQANSIFSFVKKRQE